MNAAEYLKDHGLDEKYVTEVWKWELKDQGIIMPALDRIGNVHHKNMRMFVGENKFVGEKGSHPILYGLQLLDTTPEVVYCEGQADCVKLWQEGIPAVTATGGVTKFDEDMAHELKDKIVYICLDSDKAGQKEVEKYYELISKYAKETRILDLPVGYKDICEAFVGGCDVDYFKALMNDSPRSVEAWRVSHMPQEHRIESLGELYSAELVDEEWIVDKVIPRIGFAIFAGAAGVGKSFLTLDMVKAIVLKEKWLDKYEVNESVRVLFVDKENNRASFRKRCRGLKMVGDRFNEHVYRVVAPETFELEDLIERGHFSDFAKDLSAYVYDKNIQLIIFDSLVDFISGDENSAADTKEFFENMRRLLPDRSILFPAHYTKTSKKDERTELERIAGSRNLGAQITSGLAVERSRDASNEIYIKMIKARNDELDMAKQRIVIHSTKDPENERGTIVVGFENMGEIEEVTLLTNKAMTILIDKIRNSGVIGVSRQECIDTIKENEMSEDTAKMAIEKIKQGGEFEYRENGIGRQKSFYKRVYGDKFREN